MSIIIREAQPEDKNLFIELSLEFTKFNNEHRPSRISLEERLEKRRKKAVSNFEECSNKDKRILIAFKDSEPVAYALAYIVEGFDGDYGYLDELFVLEKERSQGIGKLLLSQIIEWAASKQGTKLALNVFQWNQSAIRFYERSGFSINFIQYEVKLDNRYGCISDIQTAQ